MPGLQHLLIRLGSLTLDEIESTITVLEEAVLGRSSGTATTPRLSILLCLWLMVTSTLARQRGHTAYSRNGLVEMMRESSDLAYRRRNLIIGMLAMALSVFGFVRDGNRAKLVNHGLLGCAGGGWHGFLKVLLPLLRKWMVRGQCKSKL